MGCLHITSKMFSVNVYVLINCKFILPNYSYRTQELEVYCFKISTIVPCDVKFEVLMVVKSKIEVFWTVILCSTAVAYKHFRRPCHHHLQDEVGR
jgi:hypothetical protein